MYFALVWSASITSSSSAAKSAGEQRAGDLLREYQAHRDTQKRLARHSATRRAEL
eukprot:CAMPEP_0196676632 /NCGR_PEP_ID=MMETSP1090-20130531/5051_1 /TAXON_ID=37098 /ORGANISM="Isochrysis sp, Strain CCMP1244" /LENGTH=54 /DNA_ID=CAMNT_0042014639 /DNA_START=52 /DNA_END=216 /DNA_ORIENTATION=-